MTVIKEAPINRARVPNSIQNMNAPDGSHLSASSKTRLPGSFERFF